ncbi:urea transporter [Georgenia sp. SYP-B2076]|uniref:urea transporter n=1 Tax=Georgenia sp. SYP-B2076 TaxID=2495881 RepID=UPI000F8EAA89|nr:urea transporter [Georgenia sp. SYP-B2076]
MFTRPALAVLRSQSQVFFQGRWITGLLVLLAFAVADPSMAAFAVLGAAVQSLLSWAVPRIDRRDVVAGLHGFCGALTGAAACAALGPSLPALAWAVIGSAGCVALVLLAGSRPVARWGLPAMTAPFCVVSGIGMLATRSLQTTPAPPVYAPTGSLMDPVLSVLTSFSQVVLLDNVWSGALILLGLFLAGWNTGVWALAGAVVASATGWALGHDAGVVVNGLDGYSGVLVALALGTVFLTGRRRFPVAIVGIALTVPVRVLLARTGIPVYTWPFVLVTWGMLLVDRWFNQRYVRPRLYGAQRPAQL